MNAIEKEKIKKKLAEEIVETKQKVNKYKELTQPIAPENSIGRVSRMDCLLYTSPSPRDRTRSRMPSSA